MKRLQGKTLSTLWQDVTKHGVATCRCNSNTRQTREFPKDKGNCYRDSQKAYQALENQREHLVTEVTSSVWRRDEQVYELRTELSLQALHSEDVTQQQSQEGAGLHQHLDRVGSGNTTMSRDV